MPVPAVSVVVATRNRPFRLMRMLEALRTQTVSTDSFEVVVIDDGSDPATERVLAEEAARGRIRLRALRSGDGLGQARARNLGWREAQAPLVAFTDDDCRPAPGWLAAGLEQQAQEPGQIIQGRTEPDPDERSEISPLSHTISRTRLGPSYETCNIFYPRAVLEALDGFDEGFGPACAGEDTDLAWRALHHGFGVSFAPEALVFHGVERVGVRGKLRMAARWSSCVRVLADHPGARSMLEHRIFWNVWHYLLWRSALALILPRSLRRFVLARHLRALRARSRQLGSGDLAVPFLLALDAAESWAILKGAVRYRTLVL